MRFSLCKRASLQRCGTTKTDRVALKRAQLSTSKVPPFGFPENVITLIDLLRNKPLKSYIRLLRVCHYSPLSVYDDLIISSLTLHDRLPFSSLVTSHARIQNAAAACLDVTLSGQNTRENNFFSIINFDWGWSKVGGALNEKLSKTLIFKGTFQ